jgi:uncharacterized protein
MILDVSQIITNDGASKRIEGTVSPESFSFNGQDITFVSPVEITGDVKNISGVLYLSLSCRACFTTQCSRCMESVSETMEFSFSERLSKNAPDEDVITIDSHEIDLDDLVMRSFCSELPINYVCSKDCKGLCHVCGCNLNHTQCDCEDDYIDPRLAALKDFL